MGKNFADRLALAIAEKNNPTVMGLDPLPSYLPESMIREAKQDDPEHWLALAFERFNRALIDAVADIVPAVKPQAAYYEQFGADGMRAFRHTVAYAKERGLIVIADAKRNDIGSTAACYAEAFLGVKDDTESGFHSVQADALTVNGYLGIDGIDPFLKMVDEYDRGIFVLVRTSNPSAGDLQDLKLEDGRTVYEAMADLVADWGEAAVGESGLSSVGAVVGATWPHQAEELRRRMPRAFFLIPGYGAQGGGADDAVAGFDREGRGGIVNASRSLMLAYKKHQIDHEKFAEATRMEAEAMRDNLNEALVRKLAKR